MHRHESLSNINFDIGHPAFDLNQLHVERCFFASKRGDLLLETRVLSLLVGVVTLHFLFHFEVFVSQCLSDFLCLESDHLLESVFFLSKHHHLALVIS